MIFKSVPPSDTETIQSVFYSSFANSEGDDEGQRLRLLFAELASIIDDDEVFCFGAFDSGELNAVVFFSRLRFDKPIDVQMLSPLAVRPGCQNQGVGTKLVFHGLNSLSDRAVECVVTYGDPAYYARFGFGVVSESLIQAPHSLSMPHGWQAVGLGRDGSEVEAIPGRPRCVEPFNNPKLW